MKTSLASQEPKDKGKIVYLTFLCLGMGLLLPWNTLVTALDYFIIRLPGHDVDFVVSILANGPLFVTNLIMIIFSKYFPEKRTIGVTMILMMVLVLCLPFILEFITEVETAWIIFFITIIILASINGIQQ